MKKYLSASVMCADLMNLADSIKELEKAGIDYIHFDIMDGDFVPNITLGFDLLNAVKKITKIPLDVHMMVNDPAKFIDLMNLDENDIICIHYEADVHAHRTLAKIKDKGCKVGLAINPGTPLSAFEYLKEYLDMALIMTVSPGFAGQKIFEGAERKIRDARAMLGDDILIETDGNMSVANGVMASNAGADIFVLGTSSLFLKDKDILTAANDFRAALQEG